MKSDVLGVSVGLMGIVARKWEIVDKNCTENPFLSQLLAS
ncbi:MAG: hypothetical protein BECKG1743D_GA0114223_100853 [Candidatus Kentron sp. G]|nr:MAG: hypothetical protein BECKG1743E_GA0114224_100793 [Candidatus Kentron sp. G]VFM98809.1 MAG: hypothetical protein BECKG1743D_GA0114223_100853 [Candidatus Kentron sp. G]